MSLLFKIASLTSVLAVKLADMDQGAEFTQCISLDDFQTKTLHDDITLIDRDSNTGCCPAGSTPGVKFYASYQGAQVVCGFQDDGTVAVSDSTTNDVTTCTYNKCYVMKQDITCKDDSKQFLNGCCGPSEPAVTSSTGMQALFTDNCKIYWYDAPNDDVAGTDYKYCLSYEAKYKMEYTADKSDDQADGKLVPDKIYSYTPCKGSLVSGGDSGGSNGGSGPAPAPAAEDKKSPAAMASASVFAMGLAAVLQFFA